MQSLEMQKMATIDSMENSSDPVLVSPNTPTSIEEPNAPAEEKLTLLGKTKKAAVALSGGAMVVVGIPLIPLPVPVGCAMVAGGLSVLASEFPVAQKVLDRGKDKLKDFANEEQEGEENEDELGLGFEIVDDPDETKKNNSTRMEKVPSKRGMDSLRTVVRERIIPLVDRDSEPSPAEEKEEEKAIEDEVSVERDQDQDKEQQQQQQNRQEEEKEEMPAPSVAPSLKKKKEIKVNSSLEFYNMFS
jgi:hypothetical protein